MFIVLRFVDGNTFNNKELFFFLILCMLVILDQQLWRMTWCLSLISHHNLQIKKFCSHGYDSASDVRAWWMEWVFKHHFLMTSTVMQIMCIVLRSSCSITRCHLCSWFLFIFGFNGDIVRASCRWYDDWKMLKKLKLIRWLLLISWKQAKMTYHIGILWRINGDACLELLLLLYL